MPKFDETTTTGGFFRVDGNPYQKGNYSYNFDSVNETLAIVPINGGIKISGDDVLNITATGFADWTDSGDSAYVSYAALQTAVEAAGFLG